jgi:UDP-N-acetylglucosamine 3-dehydrogenase
MKGLLVGAGSMGSMHLRVLHQLDGVESIAVVEPGEGRREWLERAYPRIRTYAELDAAIEHDPPDFACAAVPVSDAPVVARRLLDAGVPLLLEKPMAPSVAEARAIADYAESRNVLLSIGYVERFNPAVAALKQELDRGTGGAVYHAHARRLSPFPQRAGLPGVATDLATHDLDVIRFLIDSDPQRIYAETEVLGASRGEDLLCASVRYESGVTGLIEANWHTPNKVRELSVTTEGGMFVVRYITQDLYLHERPQGASEWETLGVMRGANEGRTIRFGLHRREPLAVEWDAFLDAVARGGPPPVRPADGIAALWAAEAIVESGRSNRPVAHDEPALGRGA